MKCFNCCTELTTDSKNLHELFCVNCNNYAITRTAFNIIPKNLDNNWEVILQNYVTENIKDKRVLIDSDIIHKLFGY